MKLKNFKKIVKKNLFEKSMYQNLFMVFETNNFIDKKIYPQFESTNFLSKQILNRSLSKVFDNLKYPLIIKSTSFLPNIFNYIFYLSNKNLICNVFFIKIYFFLIKKNKLVLLHMFDKKKILCY